MLGIISFHPYPNSSRIGVTEGAERLSDLFDATAGEIELRTKSTPPPENLSTEGEEKANNVIIG